MSEVLDRPKIPGFIYPDFIDPPNIPEDSNGPERHQRLIIRGEILHHDERNFCFQIMKDVMGKKPDDATDLLNELEKTGRSVIFNGLASMVETKAHWGEQARQILVKERDALTRIGFIIVPQ